MIKFEYQVNYPNNKENMSCTMPCVENIEDAFQQMIPFFKHPQVGTIITIEFKESPTQK